MDYWIISDTHFGHKKMQEYCDRPEGFEDQILWNVFRTIARDDVLIHLGDVCVGRDEEWHEQLRIRMDGRRYKKWLIRGNHDKKSLSWYLSHGWDFVADQIVLDVFGKSILFSHKPLSLWWSRCDVNIHGHHHNTGHHPEDETTDQHICIYPEHHYSPVNLKRLIEVYDGKRRNQNQANS